MRHGLPGRRLVGVVVTAQGSFWKQDLRPCANEARFICCTNPDFCDKSFMTRTPPLPAQRTLQRPAVAADAAAGSRASLPPMITTPPRVRCANWLRSQRRSRFLYWLAKAIGYSGWDDLRAALNEARRPAQSAPFSGRTRSPAAPTPTSRWSLKTGGRAAGLARISAGSIVGAAKALHAADRIWIAGFRSGRSAGSKLLNYQSSWLCSLSAAPVRRTSTLAPSAPETPSSSSALRPIPPRACYRHARRTGRAPRWRASRRSAGSHRPAPWRWPGCRA